MPPGLWVKKAGAWHKAESFHVKKAGSWHTVKGGWVKKAGSWHKFWPVSDPLTLSYYPSWTQGYMYGNGGKCVGSVLSGVDNDDIICGWWETSQGTVPGPLGTWDHVTSIISFEGLAADLAERPVITSATLRLSGKVNYGGTGADLGVKLGVSAVGGSKPATVTHTHTDKGLQTAAGLWTGTAGEDDTVTITLNAAMRTALESDQAVAIHDLAHGTSEDAKRAWRGILHGDTATDATRPRLTVTIDYT